MFNDFVVLMSKENVFHLVDPMSTLGFGSEICQKMLAPSKVLRKLGEQSTKKLKCLLDISTVSWMI